MRQEKDLQEIFNIYDALTRTPRMAKELINLKTSEKKATIPTESATFAVRKQTKAN